MSGHLRPLPSFPTRRSSDLVSRRASPPSNGSTYSCFAFVSRFETNASRLPSGDQRGSPSCFSPCVRRRGSVVPSRSEEHTSELQSHHDLVCRLLLEKKNKNT